MNLDQKDVASNKHVWRIAKPLLSNKVKSCEKKAVKGKEIINEDRKNAEILNNFYQIQSKILNFQNIRKDNILQMKFLVQYSMQLWNSVIQTLRYRPKKCERWSKIQLCLVSIEWVTSELRVTECWRCWRGLTNLTHEKLLRQKTQTYLENAFVIFSMIA